MTPAQKEAFRREVLEEAAKVADKYEAKWSKLAGFVGQSAGALIIGAAIRALAASQPAPAADTDESAAVQFYTENPRAALFDLQRRLKPAPAADTGQAVAWQRRLLGPKVKDGNWHTITQEQADYAMMHGHPEGVPDVTCEVRPLFAHPAPLDAERVREDYADKLFADACKPVSEGGPGAFMDIASWIKRQGAMLPADRAALRQKEGGQ